MTTVGDGCTMSSDLWLLTGEISSSIVCHDKLE